MRSKERNIYMISVTMLIVEICIKVLGFVKQTFIAYYYGASIQLDSYFIASDFMNGFSNAVINAASISVIAIYTSLRINGKKQGDAFISFLIKSIIPTAVFIAVVFWFLAPIISRILAPSVDSDAQHMIVEFLRVLCGIIPLTFSCMIFESVAKSNEHYFVTKTRSLIYSVLIIFGCIIFSRAIGIYALLIAQVLTLIVYFLVLFICQKRDFSFVKKANSDKKTMHMFFTQMIPVLMGNSMVYINYMVDNAIATSLPEGAVSSLSYSHSLDDFIISIFVTSVAGILYPHFSNLQANGNISEIGLKLNNSLGIMTVLLVPVVLVVFLQASDIVTIVYYRGDFQEETVVLTSAALCGYSIRYPLVAMRDFSVQGLYAFGDMKTPMRNSVISTIVNLSFSIILAKYYGIAGITISTSISVLFAAVLNMLAISTSINMSNSTELFISFFKAGISVVPCVVVFYFLKTNLMGNSVLMNFIISTVVIFVIYICGMICFREKFTLKVVKYIINGIISSDRRRK